MDHQLLRLWLLDLVSHDRQDVGCQLASQGLLLVLEDPALASAHHHLQAAHQDLEARLLALVAVVDPQVDLVSLANDPGRKMNTDTSQLASLLLAVLLASADPQASVDHQASRAVVDLLVSADGKRCKSLLRCRFPPRYSLSKPHDMVQGARSEIGA